MITHGVGAAIDVRIPLGGPSPIATFDFRADKLWTPGTYPPDAVWGDRTPNGHDAGQVAAADEPVRTLTGFGTNNRAYLLFDGTSDFLTIPDNAALEVGAGSFVCIAALRMVSGAGFRCIVGKDAAAGANGLRLFFGGTNLYVYPEGAFSYAPSIFTIANGADRLAVWGVDSATGESIFASNTDAIARAAVVLTASTDNANPMQLGKDNTVTSQFAPMRLAGIQFFNLGVGVGVNTQWLAEQIARAKLWYGV
jgi:hypothetical protein